MNRRTFIGSVIAVSAVPRVGIGAETSTAALLDQQLKYRIVESFPNQTVEGSLKTVMGFFMDTRKELSDENHFAIEMKNFSINQEEEFVLDDIFPSEIHEISYEYGKPEVSYIVKAANRIARQTRRGMGNHYAEFSDHILVWYQGNSKVDSPIINMGKNAFKHPRQANYFVRVIGLNITDEHHEQLKTLGYTRII